MSFPNDSTTYDIFNCLSGIFPHIPYNPHILCSLSLSYVCVCVHVQMCVYMCVYVCIHTHKFVEARGQLCVSFTRCHLQTARSLPGWQGCLASDPRGSSCLHLPSTALGNTTMPRFCEDTLGQTQPPEPPSPPDHPRRPQNLSTCAESLSLLS